MYSVVLMAAMSTAPADIGGLFHRRSAGCTGTVAVQQYALVPVQSRGCSGGFAAAPSAGCFGSVPQSYAAVPVRRAPVANVAAAPVKAVKKVAGPRYVQVCENGRCVLRRVD